MPRLIGYHDVLSRDHGLASNPRGLHLGLLGLTDIRTIIDPTNAASA